MHLYDPKTLPNTIQQYIRWTGTNDKSYDYYMTTRYGRLSDHHLVKNSLDVHSQSTLYSDIMILTVEIRIARTYDFLLKLIKQLYRTTCIESVTN